MSLPAFAAAMERSGCQRSPVAIRTASISVPRQQLAEIAVGRAVLVPIALVDPVAGILAPLRVDIADRHDLHVVARRHAALLGPGAADDVLHALPADADVPQNDAIAEGASPAPPSALAGTMSGNMSADAVSPAADVTNRRRIIFGDV